MRKYRVKLMLAEQPRNVRTVEIEAASKPEAYEEALLLWIRRGIAPTPGSGGTVYVHELVNGEEDWPPMAQVWKAGDIPGVARNEERLE